MCFRRPRRCVCCARRAWSDAREDPRQSRHAGSRIGVWVAGPLLVLLGVAVGYFLVVRLDLPPMAMSIPFALTLAGIAMVATLVARGRLPRVPSLATVALMVTYIGLVRFVMPAIERQKVVDDVAAWVAGEAGQDAVIASYRLNRWNPSFRFHVGRHVEFLEDLHDAETFFASSEPYFCIMRRDALDEFLARGVKLDVRLERRGMWATSGRVLWRNHSPHRAVRGRHQAAVESPACCVFHDSCCWSFFFRPRWMRSEEAEAATPPTPGRLARSAGAAWARHVAAAPLPSPAARPARTSTTWARRAAVCGRRPTAARRGSR